MEILNHILQWAIAAATAFLVVMGGLAVMYIVASALFGKDLQMFVDDDIEKDNPADDRRNDQ